MVAEFPDCTSAILLLNRYFSAIVDIYSLEQRSARDPSPPPIPAPY